MTIANTENVASGVTVEHGKVLSYLGLNPADPKSQAVVAVAQRYDLDPLLKHVIVIPKGGVYITRDGLLHVAHRSGQLDGIVVEQEPTLVDGEWVAKVSVYRKDMRHPFTFPGRYPRSGSNREYAQEMALKAAEAHALRRAFDVTGIPAFDEQRVESEVITTAPTAAVDRMRAALAPAPEPEAAPEVNPETAVETGELMTKRTRGQLFALFAQKGIVEDEQLSGVNHLTGADYTSRSQITEADALLVIDVLKGRPDAEPADPTGGTQ